MALIDSWSKQLYRHRKGDESMILARDLTYR